MSLSASARGLSLLLLSVCGVTGCRTDQNTGAGRGETAGGLPEVVANDNRVAAGRLVGDTLLIELEARRGRWFLAGRGDSSIHNAMNGRLPTDTLRLEAGVPNRLRLINITAMDEIDGELKLGGAQVRWRRVARDGADLVAARRTVGPAHYHMGPAETLDVEITAARGRGDLAVRTYNTFVVPVVVR
ncbi:MAG: hypothetical protein ACT4P7_19610 [Gemmatimonadaceae bacterium]